MVGDGFTSGVTIGPLIDEKAVEKVEEHIADAVEHGAKVYCGGKRHALGGTFFEPTILLDVPAGTKLMKEETFGPVAPLTRFSSEQEVIAMSNDTEFGLASYFYTRDLGRAVARRRSAGVWNCGYQRRPDLNRGRSLRRSQGVGNRERRIEIRY